MPERTAPVRFAHFELRTTDPEGARAFYGRLLGPDLGTAVVGITRLPEAARGRGAPAHWLGHLWVGDVGATVTALLAAGSERLGPPPRDPGEAARVVLRDPFGAVVAVSAPAASRDRAASPVLWHALAVEDAEGALALYVETFGWAPTEVFDLGAAGGPQLGFAWDEGGRSVGSVSGAAGLPGIHPHWLFLFGVADVERAVAAVRAHGGTALPSVRAPSGGLAVMCEDPQGAAFGLIDHATETS